MTQRIEEKAAFEAVGWKIRTTTVGGENHREIPRFWDRCMSEGKVDALVPLTGRFGMLGVCADFDDKMQAFSYVIGVEALPGAKLPAGVETVRVPAAQYAVFGCVGAMPDAIQNGWKEIMSSWMPSSPYEQASPVNFELYPAFPDGDERGDPTSPKCYTEIWIPIKHK